MKEDTTNRILIIHPEGGTLSNPSLKSIIDLLLKSGFKDVDFLGNISNYTLPDILVDLSNNCSSWYASNNFYLVDDHDEINGARSMYDEKLRHLYEIFSEQLPNFYPSYSIIAHK